MKSKKRRKEEKLKHLKTIASYIIKKPLLAEDESSFVSFVATKLKISLKQAKKDLDEVKKLQKEISTLNIKNEIARKKLEYAFIKEEALKQKNLNAYLGAVNKEAEMLALEKYTVLLQLQQEEKSEDDGSSLQEKKELLMNKLFPKK